MSIKVWTAYKLREPDTLWPLVRTIRRRGEKEVKKRLQKFFGDLIAEVKTDTEQFKKLEETIGNAYLVKEYGQEQIAQYARASAKLRTVEKIVRRGYRMSSTNPERSIFNFDVSVTFREYKGDIYVIPYCEGLMRDALDFLKRNKRLQDYHYQNQTDAPAKVPAKEWKERARVWDYLTDHKVWSDFLTLEICTWDMWWMVNPSRDMSLILHRLYLKP